MTAISSGCILSNLQGCLAAIYGAWPPSTLTPALSQRNSVASPHEPSPIRRRNAGACPLALFRRFAQDLRGAVDVALIDAEIRHGAHQLAAEGADQQSAALQAGREVGGGAQARIDAVDHQVR